MLNHRRYIFIILLFLLVCLQSRAQQIDGWIVDSVSTVKANMRCWKTDSIAYIYPDLGKIPSVQKSVDEQDRTNLTISGLGILSDGDFAPFWLTNNRHGLGSAERNKAYLRIDAFSYHNINEFDISGEVDFLAASHFESDLILQQMYVDFGYRSDLKLSIGAKQRQSLLKNPELSSGGMTLSDNARPLPQVELSIPRFLDLPFTNGKWQIMGGLSYGWYPDSKYKRRNAADGNYAEKVLYHRKYGFLKFAPNPKWSFIAGLEMDTQWGGHFYEKGDLKYKGSARLKDFFKVLVPMQGGNESNITDRGNIVGNVYGSLHLIADCNHADYAVKAYHEHFFEDHSGLIFKNIPDGLYGVELNLKKTNWLSHILVEYLHSKNQSGPFLWDKNENIPVQVSGGDNYYNHVDYVSTAYYGYTTGNALFTSPIYNRGQSQAIYNTRLTSFHAGFAGNISSVLRYRTLLTYSKSWGTPLIPSADIRKQFSGLLELTYGNTYSTRGWILGGAIGFDNSDMVGDNWGGQLKVSKSFRIR